MGLVTLVVIVLLALGAAVAQPAVAHCLSIHGVFPDIAVVSVLVAGLVMGPAEGIAIGLLVGLVGLTQSAHTALAGLLVSRCVVGLLAGQTAARVFANSILVQLAAAFLAVMAADAVLFAFDADPEVGAWLLASLKKGLASAAVAPLLFRVAVAAAKWEAGERPRHAMR